LAAAEQPDGEEQERGKQPERGGKLVVADWQGRNE